MWLRSPARSVLLCSVAGTLSDFRQLGVYKPCRLISADGDEVWAFSMGGAVGGSNAYWRLIDLDSGDEMEVRIDGSWQIAPLAPAEIEERYGLRWPRDQLGRMVSGAEMWTDPWWAERNRNPVFAAVLALQRRHRLPFDDELVFLACDVASRSKGKAKIRRWRDEPVFLAREVASSVRDGGAPVDALRWAVTKTVDGRSYWWYVEYKPVKTPLGVWRQSGWARASRELPALIEKQARRIERVERAALRAARVR